MNTLVVNSQITKIDNQRLEIDLQIQLWVWGKIACLHDNTAHIEQRGRKVLFGPLRVNFEPLDVHFKPLEGEYSPWY